MNIQINVYKLSHS